MTFSPNVEKVIEEAKHKPTILEQVDYIFISLTNMCIKPASELTVRELMHWSDFLGLNMKLTVKDKPRQKIVVNSSEVNLKSKNIFKRRKINVDKN